MASLIMMNKRSIQKNHEKFDFMNQFSFVPSVTLSNCKNSRKFYSIDELNNIFFVSSLNGKVCIL